MPGMVVVLLVVVCHAYWRTLAAPEHMHFVDTGSSASRRPIVLLKQLRPEPEPEPPEPLGRPFVCLTPLLAVVAAHPVQELCLKDSSGSSEARMVE